MKHYIKLLKRVWYMFMFFGCAHFLAFATIPYILPTRYDPKSALWSFGGQVLAVIMYIIIFEINNDDNSNKNDNDNENRS